MISISLSGMSEVSATLRKLPTGMTRGVIAQMSEVAFETAFEGAGRHRKTGALQQSLYNRPIDDGRAVGHDTRRAPHAIFVLMGTRPHVIRPKNKKTLRWASGGRFFFAGKVNHPGYRGDGYLINAATLAVREFSKILDTALKEPI